MCSLPEAFSWKLYIYLHSATEGRVFREGKKHIPKIHTIACLKKKISLSIRDIIFFKQCPK